MTPCGFCLAQPEALRALATATKADVGVEHWYAFDSRHCGVVGVDVLFVDCGSSNVR